MTAASERANADILLSLGQLLNESAVSQHTRGDLERMQTAAHGLAQRLTEFGERAGLAQYEEFRRLRHDLRTPVSQLLGYCELLHEEAQDDQDLRAVSNLDALLAQVKSLRGCIDTLAGGPGTAMGASKRPVTAPHRVAGLQGIVLVIDDNADNRTLITRRLQRDGFAVIEADSGAAGLRQVAQADVDDDDDVDVILLDILMPQMDGFETLERLKADPKHCHIPVIMLSSLDEPASISRCIEAGAEDHLPKPFDPVLLRARLGNSLENKRSRDRERAYLAQIVREKQRADALLHSVIPLGVALSGERDEAKLLDRILAEARRFCGADGGALHLRDGTQLCLVAIQCDALKLGRAEVELQLGPAPLHADGIACPISAAAASGSSIALQQLDGPDQANAQYDLSRQRAFDKAHGYQTRCVLCLPLRMPSSPNANEIVGVLELWNASHDPHAATPRFGFDASTIEVLESLSLLAGAALVGYRRETELRQKIRTLEIRVDEVNRKRQVAEITETDYFRTLRATADKLRRATR